MKNGNFELERGNELKELINYYDTQYYAFNNSCISDSEYDRLYDEYVELEKKYPVLKTYDSPTLRVGSNPLSEFEKVNHPTPLLSINQKSKSTQDLINWYRSIGGDGTKILVQPKFDGITCDSNYDNGILDYAATRGNGYIGEKITENVRTVKSTPIKIKYNSRLEVRGEGIINFSHFIENLSDEYSNPRNLASGTFRQLDSGICKDRKPDVVYYDIGVCDKDFKCDTERLEFLREQGFKVTPYIIAETEEQLVSICTSYFDGNIKIKDGFNVLDMPNNTVTDIVCDGLVLKVNDLDLRENLGMTEKGPRWAFAFKFKSLYSKTVLTDVKVQIGRTGRVTPVAIFETVNLGGANTSFATLNNYEFIEKLPILDEQLNEVGFTNGLTVGTSIYVERSNDVIPKVIGVTFEDYHNIKDTDRILPPTNCPSCNGPLSKIGALHYCENINCPDRIKGSINLFCSRDAMNIKNLGISTVDMFVDKGYLKSIIDIFYLENYKDEIISIKGYGKKKFEQLVAAIKETKNIPFARVLYSLGISGVGLKTSKTIVSKFKNINSLINANYNDFIAIPDIGEDTALKLCAFFSNSKNIELINSLQELGLQFEEISKNEEYDNFKDMSFVITGTLKEKRNWYGDLIEKYSGKVSNSVSKRIFAVIIGSDAGSKETKARELIAKGEPIRLIEGHNEFIEFLKENNIEI